MTPSSSISWSLFYSDCPPCPPPLLWRLTQVTDQETRRRYRHKPTWSGPATVAAGLWLSLPVCAPTQRSPGTEAHRPAASAAPWAYVAPAVTALAEKVLARLDGGGGTSG